MIAQRSMRVTTFRFCKGNQSWHIVPQPPITIIFMCAPFQLNAVQFNNLSEA